MSQTITLVKRHNPFDPNNTDRTVYEMDNSSLGALVSKHCPDDIELSVSINGAIVAKEYWLKTVLYSNDVVVITPLVGGSNQGKQIGRIVGMIILTVIAVVVSQYQLVPAIWGMSAATTSMLAAGMIMVVGGTVLNMALAPNMNTGGKLPSSGGTNLDNSQAYSWNPQTIQDQGGAIPIIYGTLKLTGNVISGYIENVNNAQYLNCLIGISQGPISNIQNVKINDQPYTNFSKVYWY